LALPCRWSVFTTTEWAPYWNSPEMWLPELRSHRRYPGLVSHKEIEVYCPSEIDMLSNWAFLPISDKRQERIRLYAHHEGNRNKRYCSDLRLGEKCCTCGDRAALIHVPGDMKRWQSVKNFLLSHMPQWREPPPDGDAFSTQSSVVWQGGDERTQKMLVDTSKMAIETAKALGINAAFERCHVIGSHQREGDNRLSYFSLSVKVTLPLKITVESTAPKDAFVLIGPGGHSGFELAMGVDEGKNTVMKWVRSQHGWSSTGTIWTGPISAQAYTQFPDEHTWARWTIEITEDGYYQVSHEGVEWGVPLPQDLFDIIKRHPIQISVGSSSKARWAVCDVREDPVD